jgi:hypothetical protein
MSWERDMTMSRRGFGEVITGVALLSVASGISGQTLRLPRTVAGIRVPDSALAKSAAELAWAASPEYLYNHCMRTFVFASLIYARAGTKYDEELVFIASILHDLGLVPEFMSPDDRFDIDGANAAEKFLKQHNVPRERSDIVWEAIALHAGGGPVAQRRGPEVAAVGLGAVIDIQGARITDFSRDELRQVLDAYPRLGLKKKFVQSIVELCRRKPAAQLGHFTAEIGRAHIPNFACPTIESTINAAPFAD